MFNNVILMSYILASLMATIFITVITYRKNVNSLLFKIMYGSSIFGFIMVALGLSIQNKLVLGFGYFVNIIATIIMLVEIKKSKDVQLIATTNECPKCPTDNYFTGAIVSTTVAILLGCSSIGFFPKKKKQIGTNKYSAIL